MKNLYAAGRRKEYKIIEKYRNMGYYCIRSAGSFGAIDVIAIKNKEVVPIQVKQDPEKPIPKSDKLKIKRFENITGLEVRIE